MSGERASAAPVLSVVLPVFNEAATLARALATIGAALEATAESYELVAVDDGSSDGTWEVLRAHAARDRRLRALRLSRNFGKEAALAAGLEAARGRAVLVMDADLEHPPELVPEMVAAWRTGQFDVIEAVKLARPREASWTRLGAGLFYLLLSRLSGFDLAGATDYKLLDRGALEHWRGLGERTVFFRGMVAWLGLRRHRIPYLPPPPAGRPSRWGALGLVRLAFRALTAFTSLPLHLVTLAGLGFGLFALLLAGHTLWRVWSGTAVSGFATVIILQLLTGSGVLLGLGVIGEYVARIYEEVKGRPRFVVAERVEGE